MVLYISFLASTLSSRTLLCGMYMRMLSIYLGLLGVNMLYVCLIDASDGQ